MIKKISITFLLFCVFIPAFIFAESKSIVLYMTKKNYQSAELQNIEINIKDILSKEIFLFTDSNVIPTETSDFNYKNAKQNAFSLLKKYNANIFLTYTAEYYKSGIIIQFFIYDKNTDKIFTERKIYSEKEDVYKSINKILDVLYSTSSIKEISKKRYLSEKIYNELSRFNEKLTEDKKNKADTFENYISEYKDNLFININYIDKYLKENDIEKANEVFYNIKKVITEKNHLSYYINSIIKKIEYKKYVKEDDIKESISLVKKAIEKKKENHFYYYTLAEIYELYGDYNNAIEYYKNSLNIFTSTKTLKSLVFLLKKDINKYRDDIINYSKKIIELLPDDEETLADLIKIYENSLDYENELYYNEKLLSVTEKEIVKINNNQLGAAMLYRYTQKQKNILEKIKHLKNILEKEKNIIK